MLLCLRVSPIKVLPRTRTYIEKDFLRRSSSSIPTWYPLLISKVPRGWLLFPNSSHFKHKKKIKIIAKKWKQECLPEPHRGSLELLSGISPHAHTSPTQFKLMSPFSLARVHGQYSSRNWRNSVKKEQFTPCSFNWGGEILFALTYGCEALHPVEVNYSTFVIL